MKKIFILIVFALISFGIKAQLTTISDCRLINSTTGVATNKASKVLIKGIVITPNFRLTPTKGLTFNITDGKYSISIYNAKDTLGYYVQMGDSIEVTGTVDQFNGLTQIASTAITLIGSGYKVPAATSVSAISETLENSLVTLSGYYLKNAANWATGSTSGFNATFENVKGDTVDVRIDNDIDVFTMKALLDTYDITGVVSQFDSKSPYLEGYQLLPRFSADFLKVGTTGTGGGTPSSKVAKISDYKTVTSAGVADSLGKLCILRAVVTTPNFRITPTKGITLYMSDMSGGISVFNAKDTLGYFVQIGDTIEVEGKVDQFNGLTQIAATSIKLINSKNTIPSPLVISTMDEKYESSLVTFKGYYLKNVANWATGSTSGFNATFENVKGDTVDVRIDNDIDVFTMSALVDTYDITGVVSQFDTKSPYLEGYQLLPRFSADFLKVGTTGTGGGTPSSKTTKISDYKTVTSAGVADSLGKLCILRGVVTTPNFRITPTKGITLYMSDMSGGISVFNAKDTLGYFVQIGDTIEVEGKVDQFNGLTQIAATSIKLINIKNTIPTPSVISTMDEKYESSLVTFKGYYLKNVANWAKGSTSGFNATFENVKGDTVDVRIDNDIDVFTMSALVDTYDITGVVSQFDSKSPYLEGYQLLPRFSSDFLNVGKTGTSAMLPELGFSRPTLTTDENTDSYKVIILVKKSSTKSETLEIVLDKKTTATNGSDFNFKTKKITVPANSAKSLEFYVDIIDDKIIENPEIIALRLNSITNGLITDSLVLITLNDNDKVANIPISKIKTVRTFNATSGIPDSLNKYVVVKGIVTSDNFSPKGVEFLLMDNTAGITVFASKPVGGYGVRRGDSLLIGGRIAQFNGLTELNVDSIRFIQLGAIVPSAKIITKVDENEEGNLVKYEKVKMVDSLKWVASAGKSFNFKVVNKAKDTFEIRVDSDINLMARTNPLSGEFDITGVLSQYDNTNPFLSGYQLLPRDSQDVDFIGVTGIQDEIKALGLVNIFPNPSANYVTISSVEQMNQITILDLNGRVLMEENSKTYNQTFNITHLNSGIYVVRIKSGQNISSKKLIISK